MNTFSSLTSDNIDDDWGDLIPESLLYDSDDEKREDDDIDSTGELGSLAQEERVQWIERKVLLAIIFFRFNFHSLFRKILLILHYKDKIIKITFIIKIKF